MAIRNGFALPSCQTGLAKPLPDHAVNLRESLDARNLAVQVSTSLRVTIPNQENPLYTSVKRKTLEIASKHISKRISGIRSSTSLARTKTLPRPIFVTWKES